MVIQQIALSNIYTFHKTQTLTLPTTKESSLVLVLARNSAGKTSLIRALRFLFYGMDSEKEAERCVNREAVRQAKKGEFITATVAAGFYVGARKYSLKRTVRVQKTDAPPPKFFETKVELVSHGKSRDVRQVDPDIVLGQMQEILPKSLFDFFFFKGEELAHRLLEIPDANISAGLAEVLCRGKWKSAIESLASAARSFSREAADVKGQSDQYQVLSERRDDLIKQEDKCKVRLRTLEEQEVAQRKQYEKLDDEYISASKSSGAHLREKRATKKQEATTLNRFIDAQYAQRKESLGRSAGIYFLEGAFEPAQKALALMNKKGLLPPEVSQPLVDRLLSEGKCICGTDLVADQKARARIEAFQKDSIEAALSHDLYVLLSRASNAFPRKRKEAIAAIVAGAGRIDSEQERLAQVEAEIKAIEDQYDEKAEDQVKAIKLRRDQARKELEQTLSDKANTAGQLRIIQSDLQQVTRELNGIDHVPESARGLRECEQVATVLRAQAEQCELELQNSFRKFLQEHTAQLYSEVVVDGSEAYIDPETLLPTIRWAGVRGYKAGGGQQQTLVLAYIAALSQLRKHINSEMRKHFYLNEVSEQCFVMDSIFGAMEPVYQARVCAAIPGKMKQLLILVAPQQWEGAVAAGLLRHVDKAYVFHLHTNKIDDDEAVTVSVGKKKVRLATIEKEKIETHTVIETVEL